MALIERRGFSEDDFYKFHPSGRLGAQLLKVADIMTTVEAMAPDTPPRELVFVLRHDLGATAGAPPQPATDGLFAIRKGQP